MADDRERGGSDPKSGASATTAKYIVKAAKGFAGSEIYKVDLEGDYRKYLKYQTYIYIAFGNYIISLVDDIIKNPKKLESLKENLDSVFEVTEIISSIDDDETINYLTTGTFETIESAQSDETFNTIVKRLGSNSRAIWDEWMPRISSREPNPDLGIEI